ncbi:MAG: hypothetical protein L6Q76_29695, partial [Polyangiaceae bacterium]|nr:hypothetical protein [Polyangiaceae bacterium]
HAPIASEVTSRAAAESNAWERLRMAQCYAAPGSHFYQECSIFDARFLIHVNAAKLFRPGRDRRAGGLV